MKIQSLLRFLTQPFIYTVTEGHPGIFKSVYGILRRVLSTKSHVTVTRKYRSPNVIVMSNPGPVSSSKLPNEGRNNGTVPFASTCYALHHFLSLNLPQLNLQHAYFDHFRSTDRTQHIRYLANIVLLQPRRKKQHMQITCYITFT